MLGCRNLLITLISLSTNKSRMSRWMRHYKAI